MPFIERVIRNPSPATSTPIKIGLINNYSDAGFLRGEQQIVDLLTCAAGPNHVALGLFSPPSIERGAFVKDRLQAFYSPFESLMNDRLDALIVTGCEPRAATFSQEKIWPDLAKVIDWAEGNTCSTLWSCFAAHAAVWHLDGIQRRPLPVKRSGLFRVSRFAAHPLLTGIQQDPWVVHSRWNGLDASELASAGYQTLTYNNVAGVDTFIKQWRSLFIYFQGHPEYDTGALAREYRRDVCRYLDGTAPDYPTIPESYFDAATRLTLHRYESRVRGLRDARLIADFPRVRQAGRSRSRTFALRFFRNWLGYLETARQVRSVRASSIDGVANELAILSVAGASPDLRLAGSEP